MLLDKWAWDATAKFKFHQYFFMVGLGPITKFKDPFWLYGIQVQHIPRDKWCISALGWWAGFQHWSKWSGELLHYVTLFGSLWWKSHKKATTEWKQAPVGMEPLKNNQTRWEQHHDTFTPSLHLVPFCQLCFVFVVCIAELWKAVGRVVMGE